MKVLFFFAVFTGLSVANANIIEMNYDSSFKKSDIDANIFSINYSFNRVRIDHRETSKSANFTALDKKTNILQNIIDLGYEREVFAKSAFSVTALGNIGFHYGTEVNEDEGKNNNLNYSETASGFRTGIGIALNYNIVRSQYKFQPFISSRAVKSQEKYFLRYELNSDSRSTEIEHNERLTIIENSIGIKVFNYNANMMSTFALQALSIKSDDLDVKASRGNDKFELSKLSEIERGEVSAVLGFGVLF